MRKNPRPYEKYKHFKGKLYQIITIAQDSETKEALVIYQMLYSPFQIYARSLKMFMSKVDSAKYPNVSQKFRFEQINELAELESCKEEIETYESAVEKPNFKSRNTQFTREDKLNLSEDKDEAMDKDKDKDMDMVASLDYDVDEVVEPLLLDFFDADSYEAKLGVLRKLYPIITNDMINAISMTLDIEIQEGSIEKRYQETMKCLVTLEKYECNRMR